ncbi:zwei Ig domain protein zig-8-like [Portunus trituberculatus]|uniref:zwei Ig domain protein zig-8-like n=1 Tax=Portunus trituberculatus TaxID=210409 RepID=UPI001E1CEF80|nr:zwei Ig domain protein zig-8-like [Portunus trituberculatus]
MSPVGAGGPQVAAGSLLVACLVALASPVHLQGEVTEAPSPAVSVGPYFLSPGSRNITASVGQTAYLPCRVAQLDDHVQQVSWIRKRDLHVMSSGVVVFASDQRFQVVHPEKSENWTLQIRFAQVRDSGVYECQVNTEPKMSLAYHLAVVESRASLLGPEYVRAGSTLNLTCIVSPPAAPGLVYWYHNGVMLDYEGLVAILTQEGPEGTRSSLTIARAAPDHSGNYTC